MARLFLVSALLLAALAMLGAAPGTQATPNAGARDAALDPLLNLLILAQARAQEAETASTVPDSALGASAAAQAIVAMGPTMLNMNCCLVSTPCVCSKPSSAAGQCKPVSYEACCTLTKTAC